jgi:hypothetical protein
VADALRIEKRRRYHAVEDDEARAYYERFGFIGSPSDPFHLFVLIKDLRGMAGG